MKRLIATAAVCGVSVLSFTAVAGAAPGAPSPNPNGPAHTGAACAAVLTHNQAINMNPTPPGINNNFAGVGQVFCFGG